MTGSAKGGFFAIGKPQWEAACKLGINQAAAFVVMARGTGRDNRTTSWSAKAIEDHLGIGWRRAHDAIQSLIGAQLVTNITKKRSRPSYRLALPADSKECIWLPNELVTGAGDEIPPVARLKQTRDLDLLAMFVSLYAEQDLPGDGGLPRSLIADEYEREQLATRGQYVFYGFKHKVNTAWHAGPFARYKTKPKGSLWEHVGLLVTLGLISKIQYLAESAEPDSELIHALSGDEHAEAAHDAVREAVLESESFLTHRGETFDFVLPVLAHLKMATVVGVYRLHYRPKTQRTAAWYAQHVQQCRKAAEAYSMIFGDGKRIESAA